MSNRELCKLIIERYKEQHPRANINNLFSAIRQMSITDAFTWHRTKEGYEFWYDIYSRFEQNHISLWKFLRDNSDKTFIDLKLIL